MTSSPLTTIVKVIHFPHSVECVNMPAYSNHVKAQCVLWMHETQSPTAVRRKYRTHYAINNEATFHLSGRVHRHNVRIWGKGNPHVIREHERDSPKLNVWAGMFHDELIGPFFFDENTINQTNFLHMLENYTYPLLITRQPDVMFQLDGAPAHWGLKVRAFFNATFPGRWIGRDGPTPWPPRSPDINPLDFFLWGYVKTRVYKTPVPDLKNLKHRIRQAFGEVTNNMSDNTWRELALRLQVLQENGGGHVEVY